MKTLSLLVCSLLCIQTLLANTSNCDNVDDPGRIYHNQSSNAIVKFCDAWQPAPISETLPASGGSGGAVQYQWQYQWGNSNWNDISIPEGQNNNLNLGQSSVIQFLDNNGISISQTVSFRRGARRPNCSNYNYSNEVLYQVYPNVSDEVDVTQGGIFCDYPSNEHCLSIGLGNAHDTHEFLWRFSYDNENWFHTSTEVPADYCYPSGTTAYISAGSRLIGSPCDYIFKPSLEVITYRTPEMQIETVPVSCQGENDGEILVSDISGNSTTLTDLYSYSINDGQSWQSNSRFTGLTEGNYTIQVQTQHCNTYFISTSLTASPSPELDHVEVEHESDCSNNDGSIRISLVGGTGSFEYRLSTTSWQSNADFNNLSTGTYDMYARNQDGSCETGLGQAHIQGPASPTLSDVSSIPPSDCGLDNGQIQIQASGGQGPLSYTIDDGHNWSNSFIFNSLPAGQYEAGVRNQDGTCELYQSVSLDAPASPIIESISSQNPSNCGSSNGQISIQADGQGSSLQYTIDGGANWTAQSSFSGLAAGFYEISVRKSDGTCVISHVSLIELSVPSSPEVSIIQVDQPSDCQVDDGEIRIFPSSSDWDYSIDGGNTWQVGSGIFSGLAPGSYEPYVRNGDGTCPTAAGTVIELRYPNQPAIVSIDYGNPTDWCTTDGYLSIDATGGEEPLEYTRNGIIWQSSPNFQGLGTATLSPGVRNAGGSCEIFFAETLLIDYPDRPTIEQLANTPDSGCGANDGSIFIEATDGIGEFDYSIDGGNNWQSSPFFDGLPSGNYDIVVRNRNGSCNITEDVFVPVLLKPRITDIDIQTPSDCGLADASISISGDRGTGDFQFTIDAGHTWSSNSTFIGLAPGDYWLGIRNSTGYCEEYENTAITISERPHKVITDVNVEQPSDCDIDDGEFTLLAQGNGVSEYSIDGGNSWQSSRTFRDLAPGTYEPIVRNTDGTCPKPYGESFTLTYPPRPTFEDVTAVPTSDCGVSDGRIEVIAGEGIGSYQYSINDSNSWQNSAIFTGLHATTYGKLAIRNSDGTCYEEYDGSVQVSQPPKPTLDDIDIDQPSDCDLDDGTIQITADDGIGSYQYTFDGGFTWQTQNETNNLEPGFYDLGIRNSDGTCPIFDNGPTQLSYPPEPSIANVEFDQPSDCNTNDGSISIQAANGIGHFQYSIDGGNSWKNNGNFNNLQPGDYEIAVRNSNGTCFIIDNQTVELEYPPEPSIADVDFEQPSDCNTNDGSISIQAANGTGNFQYSINGGNSWKNNGNFNNLQAGEYEIAVRNSNGTCSIFDNQSIELEYPPEPSIANVDFDQPSDCNTNDGSISIQAANGMGNFQFSIDGGNSWKNNGNFNNLQPDEYEIAVRNSNGTCFILHNQSIELEYPPEPSIANVEFDQPTDCNTNDGSISIQAANGTGNFQYSIDGGNSWKNNGIFNNLQAGEYEIAVRNSNGTCSILDNQSIELEYPPEPFIANVEFDQPSDCNTNDGSISIQAANGTGNFQYSIDGGNSWKNNGNFNNLQAGEYEIAVRNSNGTCFILDNQSIELEYPPEPSIANVEFDQPSDCNTNDGSINIQAANGTGNFQYSIDGGNSWNNNGNFNNLQPGDYEIAVRNSNGTCSIIDNQTVELEYPPEPSIADVDFDQPSDCNTNDGSISIQAASGTGNFQYSIDGGNSWKNNGNFNNLQPGEYEIAVRNSNGTCFILDDQSIALEYPPEPSIADVEFDQPSDCNTDDGSISIQAANGTGNFQYSIDGGNSWNNNGNFNNLQPGDYEIAVRNSNGTCFILDNHSIALEYPPEPSIANVDFDQPSDCNTNDGSISIQAANGTGNFQYSIDGGNSWKNNGNFNNLQDGEYEIAVRNSNGTCFILDDQSIELEYPPEPSIADLDFEQPSDCGVNDGSISISGTNGIGSFSFSIDGGNTWQSLNNFSNLGPGIYEIGIANANGTCEVLSGNTVELDYPEAPEIIDIIDQNPSGCGSSDGFLEVITTGGSGPTNYSIDNGSSWSSNNKFTNLAPGVYTIKVRNQDQTCEQIYGEVQLNAPSSPAFSGLEQSSPSDCGIANGEIIISATDGTGNYQYSIDGGQNWQNNGTFSNLSAGSYAPSIRNSNGSCQVDYQGSVTLSEPEPANIDGINAEQPSDCNLDNGRIEIFIDQSVAGFQFSIDGGNSWQASPVFSDLGPGNYQVGVRKNNGQCEIIHGLVYQFDYPEAPEIHSISHDNVSNCGLEDGKLQVNAQGGIGNFEYSIDNGQSWFANNQFSNLVAGSYLVGVRNKDESCPVFTSSPITITEPNNPTLENIDTDQPTDCGTADGQIHIQVQGDQGIELSFSIDGGSTWQSSPIFNNLSADTYQVAVRNADGTCESLASELTVLFDPTPADIQSVTHQNPSNCEDNNGSISIALVGSTNNKRFSINGGQSWQGSPIFNELPPGSYSVMVSNTDGTCIVEYGNQIQLEAPSAPSILAVNVQQVSDCEIFDAEIQIDALAGSGPIYYSIDNGITWHSNATFRNLSPGVYQVVVSNENGACPVKYAETIALAPLSPPEILQVFLDSPSDCGETDGKLEIEAEGFGQELLYSVDGGSTWNNSPLFEQLAPGQYSIAIKYANGTCEVRLPQAVSITAPEAPRILDILAEAPTSCNYPTGSIQIVTFPTTGIEYSIDGGNSWYSQSFYDNLATGSYQVSIRLSNGSCQVDALEVIHISAPVAPELQDVLVDQPSGCGSADATIQIIATGTGPLQYSINGGVSWSTEPIFESLPPGQYQVGLRNEDGECVLLSDQSIQIIPPSAPEVTNIFAQAISDCGLQDGEIRIEALGEKEIEYSLDDGITWQLNSTFIGLDVGEYQISVRYIDGSCILEGIETIQITSPIVPNITDVQTEVSPGCESEDTSLKILTDQAEEDLLYSIDGGDTWHTSPLFTNLVAGEYLASIRYVDGSCQVDAPEVILIASPVFPQIDEIIIDQPSSCETNDGRISIVGLSNEELEYSIDGGQSWSPNSVFENLASGTFEISIRLIGQSCQVDAEEMVSIEAPTAPRLTGIQNVQPIDCSSAAGQIIINSEASQTVEYSIDGGANWSLDSVFSDLPVGSYRVSIRYTDGTCQVDATEEVDIEANESIAITDVVVHQPLSCDSSQASIQIFSNAHGQLEYSIDGGESWASDSSYQNLPAGSYRIVARLVGTNCQASWPDTVTIHDAENTAFANAELEVLNSTQCQLSNGSVNILTEQANLRFSLDNGEQWQTSPLFEQLMTGAYSILAQDTISGCTGLIGNFSIAGGTTPQIENVGIILPSNCASEDGGIFINPADPNLLYSIDAGLSWQTNYQFSGLNPGIYFVAVSSQDSSCQTDYEIPVRLSAQNAATIWQVNASLPSACGEADATLQVTILEDESLFEFSINQGQSWQDTSLFIGLSSGSYQIQVRNKEEGCVSIYYPPVDIPNPPVYENLLIQAQPPSFCGAQDGSVLINYTNSVSDIEAYSIDGGFSWHPNPLFDSLQGGIYEVRIKLVDTTCELGHLYPIDLSYISSMDSLEIDALGVTSCLDNDGSIRIYPPNNGSFEFSIDRGQTYQASPVFMGLAAGNYLVRMRDVVHQCEYEHPAPIEVPAISPPLILDVQFDSPSACSQVGFIEVNASPSDLLEYSIDAGVHWQSSNLFAPLPAGDYEVAVRYSNGSCSITYPEVITLTDNSVSFITEVHWERMLCFGDSIQIGDSIITNAGNFQINIPGIDACDSLIYLSVSTFEPVLKQLEVEICQGEAYEMGGYFYSEAGFYQDTLHSVQGCDSILNLHLSVNQVDTTKFLINLCETESFQYGNEFLTESGSYSFTHQNTLGCDSIVIIDLEYIPGPAPAEWQVTTPSSCETTDGSIQIINSSPFLLYSVDNGSNWQNQGLFTNLGNGIYRLLIRDVRTNCIQQEEIALLSNALPQVDTILVVPGTACEGVNGEISFRMIDTSQLYLFSIDAGQTWQEDADFVHLGAGVYDLYVSQSDSSCAYFVQHAEIYASDSLQIEVITLDYDYCEADSNGVIGVYVTQGSSPYEYSWSNGSDLPEIEQLTPGDYALTVTDSKGCQDSFSLSIAGVNGALLSDSLLQDTFYLCKGEVLNLSLPEEEIIYSWASADGFSAVGNEVQIESPGVYQLTASNLDGCEVSDSFLVVQGADHFQANFLLPDVGLINTSVFAVEVSWPIPSRVTWITDHENILQLSTYLNQTELQFTAAGTYGVRMEAQLGDCIQEVEKFITIYTDQDSIPANNGPITSSSILDFSLFPNPNDGNFELLAEFTDVQEGQMRIYNDTGLLIEARDLSGWASYRESFQLPAAVAGNYIAVLQTQYDHRTLNFVIQR